VNQVNHNILTKLQKEDKMKELLSTVSNNVKTYHNMGVKELILYWKFLKENYGEAVDSKEYLDDEAVVSDEIRRVINNGFHSIHPFMYRSKHLKDFLQIINDIRGLSESNYNHCIDAIHRLVMRNLLCPRCHGKGLAYLKLLTKDRDENNHSKYVDIYDTFLGFDKFNINYEKDVKELIEKYRIII
jgi:hypothetical protein